jgi:fatty-acyl-CoA synthase
MRLERSHDVGRNEPPLLEATIGANLAQTVAAHADSEALVSCHQGQRFSYAEFDDAIDQVALGLLALGLEKGDRLGIWSPNRAEWVLTQFATAKIGVILVTINPAYRSSELEYVLRQSGTRVLVAAQEFKGSDYRGMAEAVAPSLPALERLVFFDSDSWEELLAGGAESDPGRLQAISESLDPDDPINIQYTSGTTGAPKGATLSHRNILNNGYFVAEGCAYTERDRVCIPVPFYHCFGMVMGNLGCTTHGACMVVPEAGFEPSAVLQAVEAERCTSLYGVPTMFIAELRDPDFEKRDLTSLRTGIMAGSPCPVEVMQAVIDRMGMDEVTICYGMTETSPVSTQTAADDELERRVSTVGRVHPHVEIKVVAEGGETVGCRTPGELCTRGYSVMRGYWDEPERTSEAIDDDGWMHTGDLATMDEKGYVQIVGRIKDMVIRGGENIYPREIEEYLYTHPKIEDVQVIGVPDQRLGEELMAWVILREGEHMDLDELRDFCRDRIAHYKIPRYLKCVDEFPMTVTGKVQKFVMREQAIAELDLEGTPAGET